MDAQTISPPAVVVAGSPDIPATLLTEFAMRLGPGCRTGGDLAGALQSGIPVVVLSTAPHDVLAALIARGEGADAAIREWREWAVTLLTARRHNRRLLTLVSTEGLAEVAPRLGGRLGLSSTLDLSDFSLPAHPPAAARIAASAVLLAERDLEPIAAQLESETLGSQPCTALPELVDAAIAEQAALQQRFDSLTLRQGLLETQAAETASRLAEREEAFETTRSQLEEDAAAREDFRRVLGELYTTIATKDLEIERLVLQTAQKQQDLLATTMIQASEIERTTRGKVQNDLDAGQFKLTAEKEKAAVLEEVTGLRASVVALKADFEAATQRAVVAEKTNADLRTALTECAAEAEQVQRRQNEVMMLQTSEIERCMRALIEMEQAHGVTLQEKRRERDTLQIQQEANNKPPPEARLPAEQPGDAAEAQDTRIRQLEAELEKVYGSRSWRITGYFRAIRHRLGA